MTFLHNLNNSIFSSFKLLNNFLSLGSHLLFALLNMDDRGNDDPDREKTTEKPSVLAELRDRAGRIPPMAHRDDEEVAL